MSFFDKKEDVLEIELTRHGKEKLTEGEFKPSSYSFHDDGILYNSEKAGFSEDQIDATDRVRVTENTAYCKPQSIYSEAGEKKDRKIKENEVFLIKENNKMGTMDRKSQKTPAFGIDFLEGKIESVENLNNSQSGAIPQINMKDIEYEVVVEQSLSASAQSSLSQFVDTMPDGTVVKIKEHKEVFMAINESNTPFKEDSFDVKLFEEYSRGELEEKKFAITTNKFKEFYDPDEIKNNNPELNEDNVGYYLSFQSDESIPQREICRKINNYEEADVFNKEIECDEFITNDSVAEETDSLYKTNVDSDDSGEKC